METINYKGYEIQVEQDDFPENPRDWENLGTMVCSHSRYVLGDVQVSDGNEGFISHLVSEFDLLYEDEVDDYEKYIEKWIEKNLIMLPLFLYDHSGITISTGRSYPFNCPFDSGQVGYIYVTRDKIREKYSAKRITKKLIGEVKSYLIREVEIYDNYLTGEVFGFSIIDPQGDDVDSCWGFYGQEFCKEDGYMIQLCKHIIDSEIKNKNTKSF